MLSTIYKFELKKLFCSRVNIIALAGSVLMLIFLAVSSIAEARPVSGEAAEELNGRAIDGQLIDELKEARPVSREAAVELNGRAIDGQLIDELKPALKYVNGTTVMEITGEYEKYVPVMDVLDVMITSIDEDIDLTEIRENGLYERREQELVQRLEIQGLTEKDKEFWMKRETMVQKPFVYRCHRGPGNLLRAFQALGFFILLLSAVGLSGSYARESADSVNQLLLCSRYGKNELYYIKLAAGFTWVVTAALMVFLSVMIPYFSIYGIEGTGEMLQLVKPMSMLPCTIGHMLAVYLGIYLLAAVLFSAVTMSLSVITQNQLATICGLMGYLLIDLFAEFPDRYSLLQKIWLLRPNAILMNSRQTVPELSGSTCLICHHRDSGAVDWPMEI